MARKHSKMTGKRSTLLASVTESTGIHTHHPPFLNSQLVEQKVLRYPLHLMVLQVKFPKDVHKEDRHIAVFTFIEESTSQAELADLNWTRSCHTRKRKCKSRLARERKLARVARKILCAPK
ncbi:hypothetical protein ARMGADRAFT_1067086 [Armillaria gallica]|uniref:Uncharacterized protein n=1 Tax=Armillaria gallica TaxID=47427 RepID=A0A2H3CQE9_ARMGA|nr:hypothetical protein ARMGADRAFT_1068499 [Armillaria gallica]PBK85281.1 hypothetical protein ARMGADRAFT_1067086 [Armillaria gallica]